MRLPETPAQQIENWRLTTGQERLKEAERLFWEARKKIEQEVLAEHPGWGIEEIRWKIFRRLQALDD